MAERPRAASRPVRRILVGADGSPASLGALTFACPLADAWDAELLVAVVVEPGEGGDATDAAAAAAEGAEAPDTDTDTDTDTDAAQHALVEGWFAQLGLRRPHQVLVLSGAPGPALAAAARDHDVDLVLAGAEGTRGESGPRFGSTANLLAHRLDVPFLAIPVGCRWRGLHGVVLGVDGSDASSAAVDAVAALPGIDDATVHAVYACQPLTQLDRGPVRTELHQRAVHDVALWTLPLEGAAQAVRREVRDESHPSATLLAVADEVHADLVVVGAQPTSRLTGNRPGSAVFEVLHRSTRPVLLVPPPPTAGYAP